MLFDKQLLRKIKALEGAVIVLEDKNKELRNSNRGLKSGNTRLQGANDLLQEANGMLEERLTRTIDVSLKRDPNGNEIMDSIGE